MTANFRICTYLVVLLAVVIAVATSCSKQSTETPKTEPAPWPVAAVLEWTEGPYSPDAFGSSLVLYSDRRLIIRRLPAGASSAAGATFWTRVLSLEEFERVDLAATEVIKTSYPRDRYEFGPSPVAGSFNSLYFGGPEKGITVEVAGAHLLALRNDSAFDLDQLLEANKLPDELKEYWKALLAVMNGDFEPWKPTRVTVEFRPVQSDQSHRVRWPDNWPQPKLAKGTNLDGAGWTWIKLDISLLGQVVKLFGGKPEGEFMDMDAGGKMYRVAYRYRFPGEEIWGEFHAPPEVVNLKAFELPATVLKPAAPRPPTPTNAFELK
jgi:hypothetical protein